MTSMPASRSARAMIFAPRSWPSRPGLATTTRILRAMAWRLNDERVAGCAREVAARAPNRQAWRVLRPHEHPDAADLLRTEHAAARVLATAEGEHEAYPALLAAIGTSLGCAGSLWLPTRPGGGALGDRQA